MSRTIVKVYRVGAVAVNVSRHPRYAYYEYNLEPAMRAARYLKGRAKKASLHVPNHRYWVDVVVHASPRRHKDMVKAVEKNRGIKLSGATPYTRNRHHAQRKGNWGEGVNCVVCGVGLGSRPHGSTWRHPGYKHGPRCRSCHHLTDLQLLALVAQEMNA